jgi:hypothetical protein
LLQPDAPTTGRKRKGAANGAALVYLNTPGSQYDHGNAESDDLGIIFMLGGAVAAYVKRLQSRVSDQEKALGEFKLYVAEHYAGVLERSEAGDH